MIRYKEKKYKKERIMQQKKERYYNRNGCGVEAIENVRKNERDIRRMLIKRKKDIQKQTEENINRIK